MLLQKFHVLLLGPTVPLLLLYCRGPCIAAVERPAKHAHQTAKLALNQSQSGPGHTRFQVVLWQSSRAEIVHGGLFRHVGRAGMKHGHQINLTNPHALRHWANGPVQQLKLPHSCSGAGRVLAEGGRAAAVGLERGYALIKSIKTAPGR